MEPPAHLEVASAWHAVCAQLRVAVGDSDYEMWLAPLRVRDWDGTTLVLQAPASTEAWITKAYRGVLDRCVRSVVGDCARVAFAGRSDSRVSGVAVAQVRRGAPVGSGLNPRLSFDQFIIGDGNRLAHAAALAVAELPGQAYNPLFLYAPPGLGKTHLLHAIGNYVLQFGGGATVRYTTVEAFTNHFIGALAEKSLERFKQAYRSVDVLLIDDVQFLASKAKTEEEFFHTFNALHETGRQLVLTCDRLPRQLLGVEERLRERFEAGLVAEIAPPDFATRLTILRKRACLDHIAVEDDVLELIAERVPDNVRSLEGALIRIVAHHSLSGRAVRRGLAQEVLDQLQPATDGPKSSITRIQAEVAKFYGVSVAELLSSTRAARVAWPRQVAIHLARELTSAPLQQIGEAFGHRNHATVLHACKRVSERIVRNPEEDQNLRELAAALGHSRADRSS